MTSRTIRSGFSAAIWANALGPLCAVATANPLASSTTLSELTRSLSSSTSNTRFFMAFLLAMQLGTAAFSVLWFTVKSFTVSGRFGSLGELHHGFPGLLLLAEEREFFELRGNIDALDVASWCGGKALGNEIQNGRDAQLGQPVDQLLQTGRPTRQHVHANVELGQDLFQLVDVVAAAASEDLARLLGIQIEDESDVKAALFETAVRQERST